MVYRCKICGGALDIDFSKSTCTCEYCGNTQTYPKANNERINQLLSRADTYRRENKYDNAIDLYSKILDEEKEDPEIYWLIVLSQFGVEYVDDVSTHKKVPTINRTSRFSIFSNENYKKAIDLSDIYQKAEYEKEAAKIDAIQKKILEISSREEPYDIFICYKETDNNDNRTEDSVIAYELYKKLTGLGYKVFFSKITLNNVVGTSYEPYIYSALNSCKVMILVTTSLENVNSPWVQNEWTRFLSLMKLDANKHLIPCYKNVNPSDLPNDISYLQGLNMSSIGWEQDLEIAIDKLLKNNKDISLKDETNNIDRLLDRAALYLRNKEFDEAYRQYDRVLDFDIKNENAYIGKLLAENKSQSFEELRKSLNSILNSKNFQWLIGNGSDNIRTLITSVSDDIDNNIRITNSNRKKIRTKRILLSILSAIVVLAFGFFAYRILSSSMQSNTIQKASVGDVVTFGSYEQDNNTLNGKEKIEWIVLYRDNNEIMLISRYVLDCQSYSLGNSYIPYSDSYIKKWLSEEFYTVAFSNSEKTNINTIRLLNTDEAKELFGDVSQRTSVATKYSISKGLAISSTYGNCEYWLCPSNELSHYAAKVNANGSINAKVDNVNVGNGVRPVLIIRK